MMEFESLLAASDTEFEVIAELEFDPTADLDGEATRDPLMYAVDLGADPIPNLDFDQTLGLSQSIAEVMVRAARPVRVRACF